VDSFDGKVVQVGGVQQSWTYIFNDAETILYGEIDYRVVLYNIVVKNLKSEVIEIAFRASD
jgi:hypothetical protein